jgi:hypothetical protein
VTLNRIANRYNWFLATGLWPVLPWKELRRPMLSEAEYDATLREIAVYFEREPEPGARRRRGSRRLRRWLGAYEDEHWPVESIAAQTGRRVSRAFFYSPLSPRRGTNEAPR